VTAFDFVRLAAYGGQQYGTYYFQTKYWPEMKENMKERLLEKLDDGMADEDWESENGELLPPGPSL
jgi:hypothetical protein